MKCYTIIDDPYDWLPEYGENDIKFYNEGLNTIVEVYYENIKDDMIFYKKRSYTYKNCSNFSISSFPGIGKDSYGQDCDSSKEKYSLTSLVKINYSNFAKKWMEHYGNSRKLNSFIQYFIAENKVIEVISEGVTLSDEIVISSEKL